MLLLFVLLNEKFSTKSKYITNNTQLIIIFFIPVMNKINLLYVINNKSNTFPIKKMLIFTKLINISLFYDVKFLFIRFLLNNQTLRVISLDTVNDPHNKKL